jgi:hypothetical protein
MPETVKNWDEIIDNLHQFMTIVDNRDSKAFERFTSFSHWYYFPSEKTFAPNKFLRYRNTTLENYKGEGSGNSKDSTLKKHFKMLDENSVGYKYLFSKLEEFAQKIGGKLNVSIKIHIPNEYNEDEFIYTDDEKEKIITELERLEKQSHLEGGIVRRLKESVSIKRNSKVRDECLKHYFPNKEHYCCKICNFDFEEKYGEKGKGYIEIHHIESHAKKSREMGEHEVDPIKDLLPICSNCHSIIHRDKIPLEIEEIKKYIKL